MSLVLEFEERKDEIIEEVRALLLEGKDVVYVQFVLEEKYSRLKPQILAERAERRRRIEDPRTRASTEAKAEVEAALKGIFDEIDRTRAETERMRAGIDSAQAAMSALDAEVAADDVAAGMADMDNPVVAEALAQIAAANKREADAVAGTRGRGGRARAVPPSAEKKALQLRPSN